MQLLVVLGSLIFLARIKRGDVWNPDSREAVYADAVSTVLQGQCPRSRPDGRPALTHALCSWPTPTPSLGAPFHLCRPTFGHTPAVTASPDGQCCAQ